MPRRLVVFAIFALALAVVFVRLGVWQLSRLEQRRARNAVVASRQRGAAVDIRRLLSDTGGAHFRRARVSGTPDYANELVLASRMRGGSPGVNLLTPIRLPGTDTAVLVNRGWVYSPDGARVELARWREESGTFAGYVERFASSPGSPAVRGRTLRRMNYQEIAALLPYPIAPVYIVAVADTLWGAPADTSVPAARRVARLAPPPLDEGPHLGYALQWFGFAAIAVIGAVLVLAKGRRAGDAAA